MVRICLSNFKGGVGKTQSAVNLAVGMVRRSGLRVLLVDVDAQANASRWLLPHHTSDTPGVAGALLRAGAPKAEEMHAVEAVPGLTVLPATAQLADVEPVLLTRISSETTLRRVLAPLDAAFDVCVIDCPPAVKSTWTRNALAAAEHVLVPLKSESSSLHGLVQLEEEVASIRDLVNPTLRVLGFLHFAVAERTRAAAGVRASLQASKGPLLMRAEVRVSEAARHMADDHLTVWDKGGCPRGAEDWPAVLEEVLERVAEPVAITIPVAV